MERGHPVRLGARREQPFQSDLGRMHLRRRCFFVETLNEHMFDLGARLGRALHRAQDCQLSNLARFFEDLAGGRNQCGVACGSRVGLRALL